MKEKNETVFRHQLKLFRQGLQTHGQIPLLDYFEKTYLKEDRIIQWACWYRHKMYDCEWLTDTNMHTESWHKFFKTHILHRRSNARVDTLIKALIKAEKTYFWKWSRVQFGYVENADPRYIRMLGLKDVVEPPPSLRKHIFVHVYETFFKHFVYIVCTLMQHFSSSLVRMMNIFQTF